MPKSERPKEGAVTETSEMGLHREGLCLFVCFLMEKHHPGTTQQEEKGK